MIKGNWVNLFVPFIKLSEWGFSRGFSLQNKFFKIFVALERSLTVFEEEANRISRLKNKPR